MNKGKRIKQLREELNISQTDLAKKVGISKQTLYKYENDIVTNIPSDKLESLADHLGVTPAYLMGWEESNIDYIVSPGDVLIEVNNKDKEKAIQLYEAYLKAIPEVQEAVENLLKSHLSDS